MPDFPTFVILALAAIAYIAARGEREIIDNLTRKDD